MWEYTANPITLTTRTITPLSALNSIASVLLSYRDVIYQEHARHNKDSTNEHAVQQHPKEAESNMVCFVLHLHCNCKRKEHTRKRRRKVCFMTSHKFHE